MSSVMREMDSVDELQSPVAQLSTRAAINGRCSQDCDSFRGQRSIKMSVVLGLHLQEPRRHDSCPVHPCGAPGCRISAAGAGLALGSWC